MTLNRPYPSCLLGFLFSFYFYACGCFARMRYLCAVHPLPAENAEESAGSSGIGVKVCVSCQVGAGNQAQFLRSK